MSRRRICLVLNGLNLVYGELETVSAIAKGPTALEYALKSCEHKPHALWKFVKQPLGIAIHLLAKVHPNRYIAFGTACWRFETRNLEHVRIDGTDSYSFS
jgi:hypothetical protein